MFKGIYALKHPLACKHRALNMQKKLMKTGLFLNLVRNLGRYISTFKFHKWYLHMYVCTISARIGFFVNYFNIQLNFSLDTSLLTRSLPKSFSTQTFLKNLWMSKFNSLNNHFSKKKKDEENIKRNNLSTRYKRK